MSCNIEKKLIISSYNPLTQRFGQNLPQGNVHNVTVGGVVVRAVHTVLYRSDKVHMRTKKRYTAKIVYDGTRA